MESKTIKDIDGNYYKVIKVGEQVFMAENLNVSRFRNGDLIPEVKSEEEWRQAGFDKKPAWCYYDNNPENADKYGKFYNWYAINDKRGLAPEGWKIPSTWDWKILRKAIKGRNLDLINEINFFRGIQTSTFSCKFQSKGLNSKVVNGVWWSTSNTMYDESLNPKSMNYTSYLAIGENWGDTFKANLDKENYFWHEVGFSSKHSAHSVRCIKDNGFLEDLKFGERVWMAKNFSLNTFRNGDTIQEVKNIAELKAALQKRIPAWCYYDFDQKNLKYGKLYNYFAIIDHRELAPKGWRIPNLDDWGELQKYIKNKGEELKKSGDKWWDFGDFGFKTYKGGFCYNAYVENLNTKIFQYKNKISKWWIESNSSPREPFSVICYGGSINLKIDTNDFIPENYYLSIRLVNDLKKIPSLIKTTNNNN